MIRPIEDFIDQPAVIEIVRGYANGELPDAAAQAAVWHLNSGVSWQELSAKLTGTQRSLVREPYFSDAQMQDALAIVQRAEQMTVGQKVEPRNFDPDKSLRAAEGPSPGELADDEAPAATDADEAADASETKADAEADEAPADSAGEPTTAAADA
ncbi:MAG: hypothetical protein CMJ58_13950 [Planctomycetaceae bacterium]|nr:hypothetical protein [Planctomycetaceae bacterium]